MSLLKLIHRHSFIYKGINPCLSITESAANPEHRSGPLSSLFRLAPGWVYTACKVTLTAVSFYLPFSPLLNTCVLSGLFSVALSRHSTFCIECPDFHQEPCPVVSGLSSSFSTSECPKPQRPILLKQGHSHLSTVNMIAHLKR